jgi:hypothetical protein
LVDKQIRCVGAKGIATTHLPNLHTSPRDLGLPRTNWNPGVPGNFYRMQLAIEGFDLLANDCHPVPSRGEELAFPSMLPASRFLPSSSGGKVHTRTGDTRLLVTCSFILSTKVGKERGCINPIAGGRHAIYIGVRSTWSPISPPTCFIVEDAQRFAASQLPLRTIPLPLLFSVLVEQNPRFGLTVPPPLGAFVSRTFRSTEPRAQHDVLDMATTADQGRKCKTAASSNGAESYSRHIRHLPIRNGTPDAAWGSSIHACSTYPELQPSLTCRCSLSEWSV